MSALLARVLLDELRSNGITLKADGPYVLYGPKKRMTPEWIARIESSKPALLAILAHENLETGGPPTSETSISPPVDRPDPCADLPEVIEGGRGPVSENADALLDIANRWATHDTPLPNPPVLGITKVVFIPVVDEAGQPSKVGDATLVLNEAFQIRGFWLRRTRADKAVVEWPAAKGPKGKTIAFAKPQDEATRLAVEAAIFAAARDKGYLVLGRDNSADEPKIGEGREVAR